MKNLIFIEEIIRNEEMFKVKLFQQNIPKCPENFSGEIETKTSQIFEIC